MSAQDDEERAAQAIGAGAFQEAVTLLRPLAEADSEYALLALGWMNETGAAGPADKDAAQAYYERAAANGSSSAYLSLGWLLLEAGEKTVARDAFEAGAQLGNDECKSVLQRLDDEKIEMLAAQAVAAGEYEAALQVLQPLVQRDSEYALLTLGWIHETGATGVRDTAAARSLYERAAAIGSSAAHYELGRLLIAEGEHGPARQSFETGAERGDVPSMAKLGRMLLEGQGGAADIVNGSAWLKKAADRGHLYAQRALLGVDLRDAKSLSEKILLRMKVLALAKTAAKEVWTDPLSDKLR